MSRSSSSSLTPVKDDVPLPSAGLDSSRSTAHASLNGDSYRNGKDDSDEEVEALEAPVSKTTAKVASNGTRPSGEPTRAERVQDDWQVAYVWAFLVKFGLKDKIRRLESLTDFEQCLVEPVASRPDDVFEGVLVRFLGNLRPGLRNLDCSNVQSYLSNYIHEQLVNSTEFTVWDRPWEHGEEDTAPCCSNADDRLVRGAVRLVGETAADRAAKNPIRQAEQKGGGLFELGWRERAALLRQLVDWQLSRTDSIRDMVHESMKPPKKPDKKDDKPDEPEDQGIKVKELGLDRDKNRVWALDYSGRVWQSGNPFKRPCPLITLTSNRAELEALIARYREYGSQEARDTKGKKAKARTIEQQKADRKFNLGVENERKLAEKLGELIPLIEKEEARIQRQRKRFLEALTLAQAAEMRSTRTRRTTKKIDYTYDGLEDDDPPGPSKRSRRGDGAYDFVDDASPPPSTGLPAERQSARVRAKHEAPFRESLGVSGAGSSEPGGSSVNGHSRQSSPERPRKKAAKGWAYIEEEVPFEMLTEAEKRVELERRRAEAEQVEQEKREWEDGQAQNGAGKDAEVDGGLNGVDGGVEAGSGPAARQGGGKLGLLLGKDNGGDEPAERMDEDIIVID